MQPVVVTAINGERAVEEVRQNPEVEPQVATSSTREEHGDPLDFSTRKEAQHQNLEGNAVGIPQGGEGHPKLPQQPERSQEVGRNLLRDVRKKRMQFQEAEQQVKQARKAEPEIMGEKVEGSVASGPGVSDFEDASAPPTPSPTPPVIDISGTEEPIAKKNYHHRKQADLDLPVLAPTKP